MCDVFSHTVVFYFLFWCFVWNGTVISVIRIGFHFLVCVLPPPVYWFGRTLKCDIIPQHICVYFCLCLQVFLKSRGFILAKVGTQVASWKACVNISSTCWIQFTDSDTFLQLKFSVGRDPHCTPWRLFNSGSVCTKSWSLARFGEGVLLAETDRMTPWWWQLWFCGKTALYYNRHQFKKKKKSAVSPKVTNLYQFSQKFELRHSIFFLLLQSDVGCILNFACIIEWTHCCFVYSFRSDSCNRTSTHSE